MCRYLLILPLTLVALCLAGCRSPRFQSARAMLPPRVKPAAVRPATNIAAVHPNEVGLIPILMYHDVGGPANGRGPRFDLHGWNIRPDTLRKQLELMYAANWRPVNMHDALDASLDVPAGKIPVVLTFDDGRGGQLRYRRDGKMDPNCAVAIMEEFHKDHPDWPLRGTFFVMPRSKWGPDPFYQEASASKKLHYLIKQGFEIANHSTSHRLMTRMDAHTLQWELAECVRGIKKLAPEATMDTFALPYGAAPKDEGLWPFLLKGQDGPTQYQNRCMLIAWGGPAYPPAHKRFDVRRLTRIGSDPGDIERWIKRLKPNRALKPYVSDGDPAFVSVTRSAQKWVNPHQLGTVKLYVWNDLPSKPAQKVAHLAESKLARP